MGRGSGAGGGAGGRARALGTSGSWSASQIVRALRTSSAGMENAPVVAKIDGGLSVRALPNSSGKTRIVVTGSDGSVVAGAQFARGFPNAGDLYPEFVVVAPRFRRRGIASRIYAQAETLTGLSVVASRDQSPAGAALSLAFRKRRKR